LTEKTNSIRSSMIRIETEEILPTELGERSVFARPNLWGWWNQMRLAEAKVVGIGAGALGGLTYRQLVRTGLGFLAFCDGDIVELSNLSRQPFYRGDVFENKAIALARNLEREAMGTSIIEGYAMNFEELIVKYPDAFDGASLALVLVDNDMVRYSASKYFLERNIPVIYAAVANSGNQGYVFLQEPKKACFNCVKSCKEQDAKKVKTRYQCAQPSAIYIHQVITGIIVYIAILKLMGKKAPWHWRDTFLREEARAFDPPKREDCEVCGGR